MKKRKYKNITTFILLASLGLSSMPVQAAVMDYQKPDTNTDKSVDCEVYYDTYYDFAFVVPKDRPEDKLGVVAGSYTGVYDGRPHGIIVGCETPGAVISYSTDGGKTYINERPVYKDAGTYTTYFKVEKDGETITDSASVKILEASIDYISRDYSGLYDGEAHGIHLAVFTDGYEVLYSTDGTFYSPEKPTYKEPGTYTTYYKITKDNYETTEGSHKVIIGSYSIDYSVEDWMEKFSGHCFRHTFATRCFEAGIQPKTVQVYLGHASLQMTMDLYTHVTEEFKQDEIAKLEMEENKVQYTENIYTKEA